MHLSRIAACLFGFALGHFSLVSTPDAFDRPLFSTAKTCMGIDVLTSRRWVSSSETVSTYCCDWMGGCNAGPARTRNGAVSFCQKQGFRLCTLPQIQWCCFGDSSQTHTLEVWTIADGLTALDPISQTHTFVYEPAAKWSANLHWCWDPDTSKGHSFDSCCTCPSEKSSICWRGPITEENCCRFAGMLFLKDDLEQVPECRASLVRLDGTTSGRLKVPGVLYEQRPQAILSDEGCIQWDKIMPRWINNDPLALRSIGLPKGPLRLLELGAGVGVLAIVLARRNHTVYAMDRSECILTLGAKNLDRNLAQHQRSKVSLFRWDWTQQSWPWADVRFDAVLLTGGVFYQGMQAAHELRSSLHRLCNSSRFVVLQLSKHEEEKEMLAVIGDFRISGRSNLFYLMPSAQSTVITLACD